MLKIIYAGDRWNLLPDVLVASLEFAFAQSQDSMVEFDEVLEIRDPDWLWKCYQFCGFCRSQKKDEIRRRQGNADMICTGVMRMMKFSMGFEILLSGASYTLQS